MNPPRAWRWPVAWQHRGKWRVNWERFHCMPKKLANLPITHEMDSIFAVFTPCQIENSKHELLKQESAPLHPCRACKRSPWPPWWLRAMRIGKPITRFEPGSANVVTLMRRGYRFTGSVRQLSPSPLRAIFAVGCGCVAMR